MTPLPPYARFLGIGTRRSEAGELQFVMPFSDVVLGRPGYVHGGAIAGLLEFAAFGALYEALGAREGVTVKPVNVTVQYMRGATRHDTIAAASVTRLGNRIANVEAHAWQLDRAKPIAAAQLNVLLRRDDRSEVDLSS
ncbi:MAG TPA: PaaI family thioesterase [Allosphingosinicella sp.]|nr:PaaI family thioesterase [Allosphingosinicella sp.]